MAKDKKLKRSDFNRGVLIGIATTVLIYIGRTESVLSFFQIIKNSAIMNFLDVILPIVLGLLAYGFYLAVL